MTELDEFSSRPRTSTRDHDDVRRRLVSWLAGRVAEPEVAELVVPASNGMSSETLLFDVRCVESGAPCTISCAARLRPDPQAAPVFPVYDLEKQFRLMGLVGERTRVPVPRTLWFEPDDRALGSPFFVMERVEGEVPPDLMPYTFGSWLSEAPPDDQARLQRASVAVLAELHGMDATPDELAFLELDQPGDTPLRRHVADLGAYYEWVAADGARSPLLERAFAWLDDHWPNDESAATVSWGDSRIGNIMYRDFEPVAVLDWEMAAVAPREVDLGWMIFMHRFFQDLTEAAGFPGMPAFMRLPDVVATYESLTGHTPRDIEFFVFYGALRHGVIMSRVMRRAILFGEAEQPADPDDLITHRATLEAMLDGSYWSRL